MPEDHRITVLAVDDNEVLRYSLTRILVDAGYNVVEAKTGSEALRLASTLPDLITLDVNLPDMDGFQVCQSLKSNPHTKHIPVLHVSGTFVDPEYRARGLQGGADAYLPEPIDRGELIATVEALLRARGAEREARQQVKVAQTITKEMREENLQLEVRVRERTLQLEEQSEKTRLLGARLMKVQDEERRKLARELHDSTGQYLAMLNINLSKITKLPELKSESAKTLVQESMAITKELTSHLRTVSYLLHPPLLDEMGLASALRWYAEGFTQRSNIQVELSVSDDFGRLDEDLEIALFRIVQECLTNVHRHSGTSSAFVKLYKDGANVNLTISDKGKKFREGQQVSPGTGILGMHERMRQLNGNIQFRFEQDGTTVSIIVPERHG